MAGRAPLPSEDPRAAGSRPAAAAAPGGGCPCGAGIRARPLPCSLYKPRTRDTLPVCTRCLRLGYERELGLRPGSTAERLAECFMASALQCVSVTAEHPQGCTHLRGTSSSAPSQEGWPHCFCCCISHFGMGNRVGGGGFGYKAAAGAELQGMSSQPGSHQLPKETRAHHRTAWSRLVSAGDNVG